MTRLQHQALGFGLPSDVVKKLLSLAVVPAVLLGGYWLNRWANEMQFYAYVYTYAGRDDSGYKFATRDWLDAHHDEVRTYGQASCQWLAQQPEAPDVDAALETNSGQMDRNYVRGVADATQMPVSVNARYLVVTAAWAYLCPGTEDSRTSLPPGVED